MPVEAIRKEEARVRQTQSGKKRRQRGLSAPGRTLENDALSSRQRERAAAKHRLMCARRG